MGILGYFSATPGAAVPGMAQPGRAQQFPYPLYLYAGPWPLLYLDYLDTLTGHTLAVVPGGYYSMTAVNSRAGLTVPPSDGRWDIGAGAQFRVIFRARPAPPPSMALVRADLERSRITHGHYAPGGCRQCLSGGMQQDDEVVV